MKQRLICRIFIEAEMILFCICRILSNLVNIFKWFLQLSDTILFFIKFFWYMMQICFSIKRLKNRSGFRRSWVKHFHRHSTILGNTYQFFFFFCLFVCLFLFCYFHYGNSRIIFEKLNRTLESKSEMSLSVDSLVMVTDSY